MPPLSKTEAAADAQMPQDIPGPGSLVLALAVVFSPSSGGLPETPLETLLERWLGAPVDFSQEGVETLASHIDGSPTSALPPLTFTGDMSPMEPQSLIKLLTAEALSMRQSRHRLVLMRQLITSARDMCRLRCYWEAFPRAMTRVLSSLGYTPPRFSAVIQEALRKASTFCKTWEQHTTPWVAGALHQLRSRGRSCSADDLHALADALANLPEESDCPGAIHCLWVFTQRRLFAASVAASYTDNRATAAQ